LKNKGFKEERKTKVGLDAIDKSTTLESNKSRDRLTRLPRFHTLERAFTLFRAETGGKKACRQRRRHQ